MQALKFIIPIYVILYILYGWRDFRKFLLLTGILSIPLETTYSLTYVGPRDGWSAGIQISLSDVSFILLFLCIAFSSTDSIKASRQVLIAISLFVLASCLSVINSESGSLTLYHVISFSTSSFLYYIVAASYINSEDDLKTVLKFLMLALLVHGGIGCLQYVTGYTFDFFTTGRRTALLTKLGVDWGSYRVSGTAPHPNSFAAYMVPIILLTMFVSVVVYETRRIWLLAITVGLLSLIFTFSRGGWISFWISLLIFSFYNMRSSVLSLKPLKKLCVTSIFVAILFSPLIYGRLASDDHNSAYSRIPLMKLAYHMIQKHPIIGVGANTFTNVKNDYITRDLVGEYMDQVHNTYLLVFAETGIVGLLAFMWLLVVPYGEIRLCLHQEESVLARYVGLGILAGLVASAIHMTVDLYNSRLLLESMFFSYGIISATGRMVMESAQMRSQYYFYLMHDPAAQGQYADWRDG